MTGDSKRTTHNNYIIDIGGAGGGGGGGCGCGHIPLVF